VTRHSAGGCFSGPRAARASALVVLLLRVAGPAGARAHRVRPLDRVLLLVLRRGRGCVRGIRLLLRGSLLGWRALLRRRPGRLRVGRQRLELLLLVVRDLLAEVKLVRLYRDECGVSRSTDAAAADPSCAIEPYLHVCGDVGAAALDVLLHVSDVADEDLRSRPDQGGGSGRLGRAPLYLAAASYSLSRQRCRRRS
jgi:hypothetical protein